MASLPTKSVDLVPDVVVLLKRDGQLLELSAGRGVLALDGVTELIGNPIEIMWPQVVCDVVMRLMRQAIVNRSTVEDSIQHTHRYEVRVTPQGPDRAICVLRCAPRRKDLEDAVPVIRPFDRLSCWMHMQALLATSLLRETPAAMAFIQIDGLAEIARNIDIRLSEQVMNEGILRMQALASLDARTPTYFLGQLNDIGLAVVIASNDREAIEGCLERLCSALRAPIRVADTTFKLIPHVGAALLGTDSSTAKGLLNHARTAAHEARSSGSSSTHFFSDTLRLRALAKMDIGLEIRNAIKARSIRLRYVGRYDLATSKLVAYVGYFQWLHPVRGYVRPAEFLGVAEATGLSRKLSQSILAGLEEDFAGPLKKNPHIRVSFGPLRHHLHDKRFLSDVKHVVLSGNVEAERLELRIAERTFVAQSLRDYSSLRDLGVQLLVDEVGRGMTSLDKLARAGLWGLQLDRSWAAAIDRDPAALRVCRAAVNVASALGLMPIAAGVDDANRRQLLWEMGCRQGIGDLYHFTAPDLVQPSASTVI